MLVTAKIILPIGVKNHILEFSPFDLTEGMSLDGISYASFKLSDRMIKQKPGSNLSDIADYIVVKSLEIKRKLKWGLAPKLRDLIYWAKFDDIKGVLTIGIKEQFDVSTPISFQEFEGWMLGELNTNNISLDFSVELTHPRVPGLSYPVSL